MASKKKQSTAVPVEDSRRSFVVTTTHRVLGYDAQDAAMQWAAQIADGVRDQDHVRVTVQHDVAIPAPGVEVVVELPPVDAL